MGGGAGASSATAARTARADHFSKSNVISQLDVAAATVNLNPGLPGGPEVCAQRSS